MIIHPNKINKFHPQNGAKTFWWAPVGVMGNCRLKWCCGAWLMFRKRREISYQIYKPPVIFQNWSLNSDFFIQQKRDYLGPTSFHYNSQQNLPHKYLTESRNCLWIGLFQHSVLFVFSFQVLQMTGLQRLDWVESLLHNMSKHSSTSWNLTTLYGWQHTIMIAFCDGKALSGMHIHPLLLKTVIIVCECNYTPALYYRDWDKLVDPIKDVLWNESGKCTK